MGVVDSKCLQYIIFLGFGTTALVDCSIAAAMCLILYKSNAGTAKYVLETIPIEIGDLTNGRIGVNLC